MNSPVVLSCRDLRSLRLVSYTGMWRRNLIKTEKGWSLTRDIPSLVQVAHVPTLSRGSDPVSSGTPRQTTDSDLRDRQTEGPAPGRVDRGRRYTVSVGRLKCGSGCTPHEGGDLSQGSPYPRPVLSVTLIGETLCLPKTGPETASPFRSLTHSSGRTSFRTRM